MMCAAQLNDAGKEYLVIEKNEKCGRKLAITGKGRCNVTNECERDTFISSVVSNGRFLYSAYDGFDCRDTMEFFGSRGVKLKTERGNRVFPESDRAYDIVDCLYNIIKGKVIRGTVTEILTDGEGVTGVVCGGKRYDCDNVVVATGGLSYPVTGSTGDGYKFARSLGLSVVEPEPSLVPLTSNDKSCAAMMGLSLKNVTFTLLDGEKELFSEMGEMLFTHFGLSGPLVLSASAFVKNGKVYRGVIDLKPALDEATLEKRLLRDFAENINRNYSNALGGLLPSGMIETFVKKSGIAPDRKINSITKEERRTVISLLKHFEIPINGRRPIAEAIITRGGVSVKELNSKTMESKKVRGLYFIGEVIDVDAFTGGFNLQIAFSTAAACAKAIIEQAF